MSRLRGITASNRPESHHGMYHGYFNLINLLFLPSNIFVRDFALEKDRII
jgi:hypothetical protein